MRRIIFVSRTLPLGLLIMLLITPATFAQQVEFISANAMGTGSGNRLSAIGFARANTVSAGQYVAFVSRANDLLPQGPSGNVTNLYVRDPATHTTQLMTPDFRGEGGANADVFYYVFSRNGRFLAFITYASNLVPNDDNQAPDLFIRDLSAGVTNRISMYWPVIGPYQYLDSISISDDGSKVAFSTVASTTGLPLDTNHREDVYVHDQVTGITSLVSVEQYGNRAGNGRSFLKQISGNGRWVLFSSNATDLTSQPDLNSSRDLFARDLVTGVTSLVTVRSDGTAAAGFASPVESDAFISTDGRYVTYLYARDDLVPNDHNQSTDIFQRDLVSGTTSIVSANSDGATGEYGVFFSFAVTPDGQHVAFLSRSEDIVEHEPTSYGGDCFVRDMRTGVAINASNKRRQYTGGNPIYPTLSLDGQQVAFSIGLTLYWFDVKQQALHPIPGRTRVPHGTLIPGGFSNDNRYLIFEGTEQVLPNSNNTDGDVFIIWLAPAGKPGTGIKSLDASL